MGYTNASGWSWEKRSREEIAFRRNPPSSATSVRAVFTRVSLHWGFTVRIPGASAAQLAVPIPPPTTIVGSLAAALYRGLGLKDYVERLPRISSASRSLSRHFDCALRATLAAVAGLVPSSEYVGLCVHQEPSRLAAAPYKTGGSWDKAIKSSFGSADFYSKFLTEALPVQAAGATYGPGAQIDMLWVFDVKALANCLCNVLGLVLGVEELDHVGLVAAYGVTRVGSKEGLTSVDGAVYAKDGIKILFEGEVVKTHLYTPASCVEPITKDIIRVSLWDINYSHSYYYIPGFSSGSVVSPASPGREPRYRIMNGCVAYSISVPQDIVPVAGEELVGIGVSYGGKG
ncbi:MAG: CRISPR-associated protein Cas5 [Sulfolobales archaeon]